VRFMSGILRIICMIIVLVIGTLPILLLSLLPVRVRGAKLCAWPATLMSRVLLSLLNVKLQVKDLEKITRHQGFIFPNHISYLDIISMMSLTPVRFLGKMAVRSWPFIGWIAAAIDTVFVERGDKASRTQARTALLDIPKFPPIVLFPEGGIYPCDRLNPFRWGAFEIAIHSQIPYLPCVFVYDQRELVTWGDESLLRAVWRVASRRTGRIHIDLIPLHVVHPRPDDDAKQLAVEAYGAIASVLAYYQDADQIVQEGI